jgi:hypothetical protein
VYYDARSEPLAGLLANVGEVYSMTTAYLLGPTGRSDHVNFWQSGYPAVFVHEMDFSPVYHSTNDLLEFLEMDYEAEVIKMVLATVLHLANIADPPRDLVAYQVESGEVLVEWTHSPDADLLGYKVEVVDRLGDVIYETYTKENFALLDVSGFEGTSKVRVRSEDVLGFGEASEEILVGSGRALVAGATPNPITEGCRFDVFVPGAGGQVDAVVKVMDAIGRQVAEVHNGPLDRGSNSLRWSGRFANGNRVPGGVYFFVIETASGGEAGGKLMVVR